MEDPRTVQIACSQPGGLMLRLAGIGEPGSGPVSSPRVNRVTLQGPAVGTGGGINSQSTTLPPFVNKVDAEFWADWSAQNTKNALLTSGVVYEVKDDGKPAEDHISERPPETAEPAPERSDTPADGPTVQQWVDAGYQAKNYPPTGYDSKSTQEEIDAAIKAQEPKPDASKEAAVVPGAAPEQLDAKTDQTDQSSDKPKDSSGESTDGKEGSE